MWFQKHPARINDPSNIKSNVAYLDYLENHLVGEVEGGLLREGVEVVELLPQGVVEEAVEE